jgi:hypothetical protein
LHASAEYREQSRVLQHAPGQTKWKYQDKISLIPIAEQHLDARAHATFDSVEAEGDR